MYRRNQVDGSFTTENIQIIAGVSFFGRKILTRRERLKSALYLRLKKRKTFFSFGKNFFRKMSHSAEKCKRGTLFDL